MKRCPNCEKEFDEHVVSEGICSECGYPLEDDHDDADEELDEDADE